MSWYRANVPHMRMKRGQVYWLQDTPHVALRVENGFLEHASEPDWHKDLPPEKRYDKED